MLHTNLPILFFHQLLRQWAADHNVSPPPESQYRKQLFLVPFWQSKGISAKLPRIYPPPYDFRGKPFPTEFGSRTRGFYPLRLSRFPKTWKYLPYVYDQYGLTQGQYSHLTKGMGRRLSTRPLEGILNARRILQKGHTSDNRNPWVKEGILLLQAVSDATTTNPSLHHTLADQWRLAHPRHNYDAFHRIIEAHHTNISPHTIVSMAATSLTYQLFPTNLARQLYSSKIAIRKSATVWDRPPKGEEQPFTLSDRTLTNTVLPSGTFPDRGHQLNYPLWFHHVSLEWWDRQQQSATWSMDQGAFEAEGWNDFILPLTKEVAPTYYELLTKNGLEMLK